MRRQDDPPGPYVTQIALVGWENAKLPRGCSRISDLSPEAAVEIRWLWDGGAKAAATLWREHENYLRREAERLNLPPLYSRSGSRCFWSERVALELDARKDK